MNVNYEEGYHISLFNASYLFFFSFHNKRKKKKKINILIGERGKCAQVVNRRSINTNDIYNNIKLGNNNYLEKHYSIFNKNIKLEK